MGTNRVVDENEQRTSGSSAVSSGSTGFGGSSDFHGYWVHAGMVGSFTGFHLHSWVVSCSLLDSRLCYKKSKISCGDGVEGGGYQAESGDSGPVAQTVKAACLNDHARSEPGHGP